MTTLFEAQVPRPVADRLRPISSKKVVGQGHLLGATAPKSNAVYRAFKTSVQLAKETGSLSPPKHILNASNNLMKNIGYGVGYQYDHDSKDGFSGQNYFPDGVKQQSLYRPDGKGFEKEIVKRLDYWRKIRKEKGG